MKNALFVYLFFSVTSAFASWTPVSQGVNGNIYLVNYSTLKEIGGYKRIWVLENYNEPLTASHKSYKLIAYSSKVLQEFDCPQSAVRTLLVIYYSQHNGGGSEIGSPSVKSDWQVAIPNTIPYHILSAVCKDKLIYRGRGEGGF